MTNNTITISVTLDVTYAPGISEDAAVFDTFEWAERVAKDARMGTNVQDVQVRPQPDSGDRIVHFTPTEVTELADFLRTFEASPKAVDLLHRISMRSIYAVADAEDSEPDDEPRAPGFDDVKNQAVIPMTSISNDERATLEFVKKNQDTSFDGWIKPVGNWVKTATTLVDRGLLRANSKFHVKTTEAGDRILSILRDLD